MISYLVFGAFLFFTIIALSISGCGANKKAVESGIGTDDSIIAKLRAAEQLSAYLRTSMPDFDTLSEKMFSLKDKGFITEGADEFAVDFLKQHPELYVGKNYGEFISGLYVYRDGNEAPVVFEIVTMAMFHRKLFPKSVREANEGTNFERYFSPIISVKYGMHKNYILGQQDLMSISTLSISSGMPTGSKILPTYDRIGVTVKLHIHGEGAEHLPTP